MPNTIAQKFRIKEGMTLLALNAPANFADHLQALPANVTISAATKTYDQVHWFVLNSTQLKKEMAKVVSMVKEDVVCWIYYPKGTSGIQTDLTRDSGWEALMAYSGMQWLSLVSFDDTWSAFGFRLKNEADRKKEAAPKVRDIFNYIDPEKKTVRLPDELAEAFAKNTAAAAQFNALSFTNKKEYVEWIVTAKRAETKTERVKNSVERLLKGWKNPRNI